jgi:ATP-dependent helicase/nuclease subunit B
MILSKNKIQSINLDELLDQYVAGDRLSEILIIVPTNRKIRYLKRELISLSPHKVTGKLNLHTLGTLSTKIFESGNFLSGKVLSESSAAVLLNKSFLETELKYFSNYKNGIPHGTLDRIKNVISEYKRNGISPERILIESEKLIGSEKIKALDIAAIYKNYNASCKKLNAYEIGDIYSDILALDQNNFQTRFNGLFPEVKDVIINGFDEFTLPEIEIINTLSEISGINLFVVFDYYNYNPALFSHLDLCYKNLKAKAFNEIIDMSSASLNVTIKRIRENLFLLDEKDQQKNSDLEVTKIIASSPQQEIELIAKEIKTLMTQNNVSPDSICLAFNLISDHALIVRDIFYEYGIPFNLTDRFSLSESPPIISLINFIEILENNFYYKNIFRAFSGRWIDAAGIDLSNLLRVSSNLKIVSGYSNWIESLRRAVDEIKMNDIDENNNYLQVEFYEKAIEDIKKINGLLNPFREKQSLSEFNERLKKLILTLGFSNRLVNDNGDYIEKNVKALTIFIETIDELFVLLADEYGKDKKFSLSFYLNQIKTALQFTRYNIKERHGSGVLVTSVNEIRGLRFSYLFIGGLVDGEFPTRYQPEIFFSGSYKKDEYKHVREERYHFYQALCTAYKGLYLTYSLKNEKKEYTPSTFVSDFTRLFLIKEKSPADYENLIYSKSELLKHISQIDIKKDFTFLEEFGIDSKKILMDLEIDELRQKKTESDSPYTGYIFENISEAAKEKLSEQNQKQYSASQLEEYAKCPFQYFLKRILQLESIEEPSEELEAFELGSIVHSILYDFYKIINEKNITLAKCNDETFKKAEKLIFTIAENKFEKMHLNSPVIFYEKEKIFGISGSKRNSILYKFLEEERNNDDGYLPQYFELEFGHFDKNMNDESDLLVGAVKVRGKIDRVDIDSDQKRFKVIDYKLGGKKPAVDELLTGISLQLPLYLYASKKLIEAEVKDNFDPASSDIYSLKLTGKDFGRKTVHTLGRSKKISQEDIIKSNEDMIKICNDFIPAYVEKIVNGKFNLSTLQDRDNKVCKYCDFISICRVREAN